MGKAPYRRWQAYFGQASRGHRWPQHRNGREGLSRIQTDQNGEFEIRRDTEFQRISVAVGVPRRLLRNVRHAFVNGVSLSGPTPRPPSRHAQNSRLRLGMRQTTRHSPPQLSTVR